MKKSDKVSHVQSEKLSNAQKYTTEVTEGINIESQVIHELSEEHKVVETIPSKDENVMQTKTTIERKTLTVKHRHWIQCTKELNCVSEYIIESQKTALRSCKTNILKVHSNEQKNVDGERVLCRERFLIVRALVKKRCATYVAKPQAMFAIHDGLPPAERLARVCCNAQYKLQNDKYLIEQQKRQEIELLAHECDKAETVHALKALSENGNVIAHDILNVHESLDSLDRVTGNCGEHITKIIDFHLPKNIDISTSPSELQEDVKADIDVTDIAGGDEPLRNEFMGMYSHQIAPKLDDERLKQMLNVAGSERTKFKKLVTQYFKNSGMYLRSDDVGAILNSFVRSIIIKLTNGEFLETVVAWKKYVVAWKLVGHYFFDYRLLRDGRVEIKPGLFDFCRRACEVEPTWKSYNMSSEIEECAKHMGGVFSHLDAFSLNSTQLNYHLTLYPCDPRGDEKSCFAT